MFENFARKFSLILAKKFQIMLKIERYLFAANRNQINNFLIDFSIKELIFYYSFLKFEFTFIFLIVNSSIDIFNN